FEQQVAISWINRARGPMVARVSNVESCAVKCSLNPAYGLEIGAGQRDSEFLEVAVKILHGPFKEFRVRWRVVDVVDEVLQAPLFPPFGFRKGFAEIETEI